MEAIALVQGYTALGIGIIIGLGAIEIGRAHV